MKIIHCADIHLDSKMDVNFDKETAKERRNELIVTYKKMVGYAAMCHADAIIIAGDLYDKRNVSAAARNAFINSVKDNPDIMFFYLRGNHDADSVLGAFDEIPDNLKLFGNEWTSYRIKSVDITGIELDSDNAQYACDSLILDRDNFNIVVMHGQKSEYAGKDKTETINLRALRNKGIDYLALGHVHSHGEGELDGRGKWCYPGCLEGRGFDECGEHGFVMLDIDEDKLTYKSEFIPFAQRRVCEIDIDISDCMDSDEIENKIIGTAGDNYTDAIVKIVLKGDVSCDCEKDTGLITKTVMDKFYAVRIYDESVIKIDYDSFADDVSLKGEFVRLVKESDMDDEVKAQVIKCGIQALSGRHEL